MKELWDNIQRQISNNIHPDKELVQNLLDILIPPEFQYIINNTKLYLSPDGEISQIPFQYMLRNFNNKSITILPGFSFLNLNNSKKETICALSARSPSYSNDIISNNILLGLRGRDISPLLFADQEVQNIRRIYNSFNNSNATVVENVTESWVKTNIESFDIIHFAAHSFPFISEVNEGGILLVSSSEDDGILSTSEIATLTLENKLVFLSSCETNVGDFIPGEGINSIARSLLFAGADGVIASLWPVNDKTAVSITDQFYSIYLKTNDPAIAIYKAQELVFTNNPHYSPSQSFPFIYISK
jgi:CHAT domain-containing protein